MSVTKSEYSFPHSYQKVQSKFEKFQIGLVGTGFFGIIAATIWVRANQHFDSLAGSIISWVAAVLIGVVAGVLVAVVLYKIHTSFGKMLSPNKKIKENWEAFSIWLKEHHNIIVSPIVLTYESKAAKFFRNYIYEENINETYTITDTQGKNYTLIQTSANSPSYYIKESSSGLYLLENQKMDVSNFHYSEQEKTWKQLLRTNNVQSSKLTEISNLLQKLDRCELTEAQISTVQQVIAKTNDIYFNYVKLATATDANTAEKATDKALTRLTVILKNVQTEYVSSIQEQIDTQVSWIDTLLGREQKLITR